MSVETTFFLTKASSKNYIDCDGFILTDGTEQVKILSIYDLYKGLKIGWIKKIEPMLSERQNKMAAETMIEIELVDFVEGKYLERYSKWQTIFPEVDTKKANFLDLLIVPSVYSYPKGRRGMQPKIIFQVSSELLEKTIETPEIHLVAEGSYVRIENVSDVYQSVPAEWLKKELPECLIMQELQFLELEVADFVEVRCLIETEKWKTMVFV